MRDSERNAGPAAPSNNGRSDEKKRGAGLGFHEYQELKSSVHRQLITKVDVEKVVSARDTHMRSQVFSVIQALVENLNAPLTAAEKNSLSREVLDEVFGLGRLEPLLQHPGVYDMLVNGFQQAYV